MSTVAERIAAINAKKKETPPPLPRPKPKPLEIKVADNTTGWLAQKPDVPGVRTFVPVKKVGTVNTPGVPTLSGIVSPKSLQQNVSKFPSPSSSPPPIRTSSPPQETTKPNLPILNSSSVKVPEKQMFTATIEIKEVKPASIEVDKQIVVIEEEKKITNELEAPVKSVVAIPVKSMDDIPKFENRREDKEASSVTTTKETTSKVEEVAQTVETNESKSNENSEAKKSEEIEEETKVPERGAVKQAEESKTEEIAPPPIPVSREEVPETTETESEANEVVDRREASGSLVLLEEDVVPLPIPPTTTEKRISTVTFGVEVIEHEISNEEDEKVVENTEKEEEISSPPPKPAISSFVDIDDIPPPPPPPPLEATRTNSVRFGVADEIAVHEYDYDEFDSKSDAGNSTGAPPRRRSSLSQKVVSILKRASSRSLRKKSPNIDDDEDDRRNGVHWG